MNMNLWPALPLAKQTPDTPLLEWLRLEGDVQRILEREDVDWSQKFDLIFEDGIAQRMREIHPVDYYDPDSSYEEDVRAFCGAMHREEPTVRGMLSPSEAVREFAERFSRTGNGRIAKEEE